MDSACNDLFKDDYIFRMTDDTGMFQHSKYALPDPNHGYTTDDNARALIMALMLYERYGKEKYLDLVYRYATFLLSAQTRNGKFRNFMRYDRNWLEKEGSEDCFGRCLWALGFALSHPCTPKGVKESLSYIMQKAMPHVSALHFLRSKAYSILGLASLESDDAKRIVSETAESLCSQYDGCKDGEWKWFEDTVTYCNHVLPWSLIEAYKVTGKDKFLQTAEESLDFLSKVTFREGYFKPVGCNGWFVKGKTPAEFDEQPVEACEGVFTYLATYEATGSRSYLQKAKQCYEWYRGFNSKKTSLIDSESGGCYDGLKENGLNRNIGAESLVSYVMAFLKISSIAGEETN
ncbi:MAG: Glycosyltransferase [Thermocaproicibacter melissae]|jgi:hypothetical protein|uniref:glycosyltransferase n=1 Tax=Thermocaproicibacter melissae TaxID=2966552 RepID=UPI003A102B61